MRKERKLFKESEKGQSVVELALFLPIILLITFFALEISLGTYYKLILNNIVREVARVVSVSEGEAPEATEEKINNLLQAYSANGPLVLPVNDPEKFELILEENILDITYKSIEVKATYRGLDLPFIGPLTVSSNIVFPKLYVSPDIWQ